MSIISLQCCKACLYCISLILTKSLLVCISFILDRSQYLEISPETSLILVLFGNLLCSIQISWNLSGIFINFGLVWLHLREDAHGPALWTCFSLMMHCLDGGLMWVWKQYVLLVDKTNHRYQLYLLVDGVECNYILTNPSALGLVTTPRGSGLSLVLFSVHFQHSFIFLPPDFWGETKPNIVV